MVRGLQPEHWAADCTENLLCAELQLEMRRSWGERCLTGGREGYLKEEAFELGFK